MSRSPQPCAGIERGRQPPHRRRRHRYTAAAAAICVALLGPPPPRALLRWRQAKQPPRPIARLAPPPREHLPRAPPTVSANGQQGKDANDRTAGS
jgi:hypothetical protein